MAMGATARAIRDTLQRLIDERLISGIPVVNNGVCVEQTYTIMARAGVWPMMVDSFVMPSRHYSG